MVVGTIKTGVDRLIDLLKKIERITVQEAAEQLKIEQKVLQRWVDFLVEERIISIEYKFTVPYIYYNKAKEKERNKRSETTLKMIKENFFERAQKKKIPEEQILTLWNKKLSDSLILQQEYFLKYAQNKKIDKINQEWIKFHNGIIQLDKKS